ncbi:uncharacterized protein ASCRUDRAFT_79987 [Ascoidea rubescens DSM 1968]|uniref:Uncharacterized protein n=1 Tax=Ascoidea rubescens DSM 1968 TaxID=1344418 RepID=A0A1D2VLL4_9ASCO|nr:hypothetical protein ASCRUDRAFT_79987 [Ascoidea rubescens DSM 1968]ODV62483.1 hypothetical protein ASCRUDRAFT_79987 [Ascoidea rubescens DSM 1968]
MKMEKQEQSRVFILLSEQLIAKRKQSKTKKETQYKSDYKSDYISSVPNSSFLFASAAYVHGLANAIVGKI